MYLTKTILRLIPCLICSLLVTTGCKPPEDSQADQEYLRDPTGVMLPIPVKRPESSDARSVALFLRDGNDPHQRVQALELAQRVGATSGYTLTIHDANGNHAKQSDQIRQALNSNLHAALVLPVDAAAVEPDLAQIKKTGTYVICLSHEVSTNACDTLVFSDPRKLGAEAGMLIVSALQRRAKELQQPQVYGRILEIRIDESHPSSQARHQGLMDAIAEERGIVLVHDAAANGNPTLAATIFEEAIRMQKQLDAVYVQNDFMARGVHQAALKAGVRDDLFIVGTDGTGGAGGGLEMIHQNQLDATVHQPLLVDLAWRVIVERNTNPSFRPKERYEIPPLAITPKNLGDTQSRGAPTPSL